MITEQEVRLALNAIIDPCSAAAGCPAGLDDMGLVRRVSIAAGADSHDCMIEVVIAVTEFGCLMGAPFADAAYKALEQLGGNNMVIVTLDNRFDWDRSDLAPAYQERLRKHRALTIPIIVRGHHGAPPKATP